MDEGSSMQTVDYDSSRYSDVRQYLIGLLNCPVVRGRQNYSPLPEGCVLMQNIDDEQIWQDYDDNGDVTDVVTRRMQLDFFGKDASARARLIGTMWKTPYSVDALKQCAPLYCNNVISQQFVNEKGIYEDRCILDVFLQFEANYEYNVDKTDQLSVEIKRWR